MRSDPTHMKCKVTENLNFGATKASQSISIRILDVEVVLTTLIQEALRQGIVSGSNSLFIYLDLFQIQKLQTDQPNILFVTDWGDGTGMSISKSYVNIPHFQTSFSFRPKHSRGSWEWFLYEDNRSHFRP
jgi:hypothetical protein